MNPRRLVLGEIWRMYRTPMACFLAIMVAGVTIADIVASQVADPAPGIWMYVTSAFRYWLAIVGIMAVTVHLRQFVSGGLTRRDFLAGTALFGVLGSVAFAVLVPLGHGIEYAVHGGSGFSLTIALRDFAHTLPACLAAFVSGTAVAAGFYRYGPWPGLALMVPALLPAAVAESLLPVDADGQVMTRFTALGVAVVVSLVVTALVALLHQRELHDVPIRRSALG